ncbi:MAG: helix-hairpin-helix domain-containing protein [Halanaerobiales bacterium]|nr:helix-hairpin-helix domain-containing protein [Halanaerobiales bacterium]
MIYLNEADMNDLTQITGIGYGKAFNIIKYRKENNGFETLEELKEVKGIADKTYELIKSELTLGENKSAEEKVKISINTNHLGIETPAEMHLVGEMNDWNLEDKSYNLKEEEKGIWSNTFDLEAGAEYKIMYDSSDWEAGKYIGDNGDNFVV